MAKFTNRGLAGPDSPMYTRGPSVFMGQRMSSFLAALREKVEKERQEEAAALLEGSGDPGLLSRFQSEDSGINPEGSIPATTDSNKGAVK